MAFFCSNFQNLNKKQKSIGFKFNGMNIEDNYGKQKYVSINALPAFLELSIEELRFNDYTFSKTGLLPPQSIINKNIINPCFWNTNGKYPLLLGPKIPKIGENIKTSVKSISNEEESKQKEDINDLFFKTKKKDIQNNNNINLNTLVNKNEESNSSKIQINNNNKNSLFIKMDKNKQNKININIKDSIINININNKLNIDMNSNKDSFSINMNKVNIIKNHDEFLVIKTNDSINNINDINTINKNEEKKKIFDSLSDLENSKAIKLTEFKNDKFNIYQCINDEEEENKKINKKNLEYEKIESNKRIKMIPNIFNINKIVNRNKYYGRGKSNSFDKFSKNKELIYFEKTLKKKLSFKSLYEDKKTINIKCHIMEPYQFSFSLDIEEDIDIQKLKKMICKKLVENHKEYQNLNINSFDLMKNYKKIQKINGNILSGDEIFIVLKNL